MDMINRYELERANGAQTLLKVRLWDYNGVDMDYKIDDGTCACALESLKGRMVLECQATPVWTNSFL